LYSHISQTGVHLTNPTHAAYRDAFVKLAVQLLELPASGGQGAAAHKGGGTAAAVK